MEESSAISNALKPSSESISSAIRKPQLESAPVTKPQSEQAETPKPSLATNTQADTYEFSADAYSKSPQKANQEIANNETQRTASLENTSTQKISLLA